MLPPPSLPHLIWIYTYFLRHDPVERAMASHQSGPGSISARCQMRVEFVAGSRFAPNIFLKVLRFSSLHKKQHFQIPIWPE